MAGTKAREQFKAPPQQRSMPSTSTHDCNGDIETTFGVSAQLKSRRSARRCVFALTTILNASSSAADECSTCSSGDSCDDEDDYADFLSLYYASVRAHQHKKNASKAYSNSGIYALKAHKVKRYNGHAAMNSALSLSEKSLLCDFIVDIPRF